MNGGNRLRALPSLPYAALTFLMVSAVIAGVLAMHVWMGGHGPSAHGGATPGNALAGVTQPAAAGAHQHAGATHAHASVTPEAADAAAHSGNHPGAHPCGDLCAEEGTMLGLCVLALIVVTVLAFLLPAGRPVLGAVLLRRPPPLPLKPLAIPAPSLIRLCISRT